MQVALARLTDTPEGRIVLSIRIVVVSVRLSEGLYQGRHLKVLSHVSLVPNTVEVRVRLFVWVFSL